MSIKKKHILFFSVFLVFVHTGNLSSDINQLRTCHRCHRIFPVLSDLFNHMCDDEDVSISSKLTRPLTKSDIKTTMNNNTTTSLLDKMPSTSPKSFKLNSSSLANESSTSSRINKLISPVTSLSSPTIKQTKTSLSIQGIPTNHLNKTNQSSLRTEHIPVFKRPLFQPYTTTSRNRQQQHSSSAYIYLRNPSASLPVNS